MTTRSQWAELLLDAIPECTSYQDGVLAVVAWGQSERSYILAAGGAKNNLLDTERRWPGSSNFNSAGVQNYATQADGIAATVATITNGLYSPLLAAIRTRCSADLVCAAVCASPWGSKPTPAVLAAVRAAYGPIAGALGVATDEAVANVQRLMGITVDGVVGPATWGVLLAFGRA